MSISCPPAELGTLLMASLSDSICPVSCILGGNSNVIFNCFNRSSCRRCCRRAVAKSAKSFIFHVQSQQRLPGDGLASSPALYEAAHVTAQALVGTLPSPPPGEGGSGRNTGRADWGSRTLEGPMLGTCERLAFPCRALHIS